MRLAGTMPLQISWHGDHQVRIAVVGKYTDLSDAYLSVTKASANSTVSGFQCSLYVVGVAVAAVAEGAEGVGAGRAGVTQQLSHAQCSEVKFTIVHTERPRSRLRSPPRAIVFIFVMPTQCAMSIKQQQLYVDW